MAGIATTMLVYNSTSHIKAVAGNATKVLTYCDIKIVGGTDSDTALLIDKSLPPVPLGL